MNVDVCAARCGWGRGGGLSLEVVLKQVSKACDADTEWQ